MSEPAHRAAPAPFSFDAVKPNGFITCKVLDAIWMDALAAGEKLVEFQRYSTDRGNALKSVTTGTLVLFGPTKSKGQPLHAIGLTAADPTCSLPRTEIQSALQLVPPHLREPLYNEYLAPALRFDYVHLCYAFDVRQKKALYPRVLLALWCNSHTESRFHEGENNNCKHSHTHSSMVSR